MTKPRIPVGATRQADSHPAPTQRDLPITPSQATLLRNLQGAVAAAQTQMNTALSAVLAGHDIASAEVLGVGGTPERPMLTIRVAPEQA